MTDEDLVVCDRCGGEVGAETVMNLGPDKICEICWDDL